MVIDRKPIAFTPSGDPVVPEEVSDDFFELTQSEVKILYKDLLDHRKGLEERPLKTAAMKEEEHKEKLAKFLVKYKCCAIRVQFPDRSVLQGLFEPEELFGEVINFVRSHITDPKNDFYLFTAPPKFIPKDTSKLVDLGYGAGVNLYFGSKSLCKPPFINTNLLSTKEEASKLISVHRVKEDTVAEKSSESSSSSSSQRRSPRKKSRENLSSSPRRTSDREKAPTKWFKQQ